VFGVIFAREKKAWYDEGVRVVVNTFSIIIFVFLQDQRSIDA
jgi:hypothetical protein